MVFDLRNSLSRIGVMQICRGFVYATCTHTHVPTPTRLTVITSYFGNSALILEPLIRFFVRSDRAAHSARNPSPKWKMMVFVTTIFHFFSFAFVLWGLFRLKACHWKVLAFMQYYSNLAIYYTLRWNIAFGVRCILFNAFCRRVSLFALSQDLNWTGGTLAKMLFYIFLIKPSKHCGITYLKTCAHHRN